MVYLKFQGMWRKGQQIFVKLPVSGTFSKRVFYGPAIGFKKMAGAWMADMFRTTKWPSPLYLELFLPSSGRNSKKENRRNIVG